MPFKKISKNKFKSPSGKTYTEKQVKLYHSLGKKFPKRNAKHKKTSKRV